MTEPLDPIAAGVASVLKSLRTRAGLQEDRLADTELALDTLGGLDRVREFAAAGVPVQRAIVRAVTAAAGSLEPTDSIVADVSLRLRLSEMVMPGTDIYAKDLGSRRKALLKHWDRLHELRSAPSYEPVPSERTLRLETETTALMALAVALTAGRLAPGERRLASNDVTGALDQAPESLIPVAEPEAPSRSRIPAGREPPRHARTAALPPPLVRSQIPLLVEDFQRISRALRNSLVCDQEPRGWPHDLREGSKPATPLATAFGLRTMILLEGFLTHDLIPIAKWLTEISPGGGYAAQTQNGPSAEGTAAVLETLHRINNMDDFSTPLGAMKANLKPFDRTRPFILTTVLEASAQLGSDPDLTRSLVEDLLKARRDYGSIHLWAEKAEEHLVSPAPSIAHTARAVRALMRAHAALTLDGTPDALATEAREAAEHAAAWLADQPNLENVSELIDRQMDGGGVEPVYVRHFTSTWVVKALVSVGLPTTHPSVSYAVARIWRDYSIETALWSWRNGDLPVWMTFDAVDALRQAAMAASIRSGGIDAP
jgi:hypothetical protein